jgi:hypothetical protein
MHEAGLDDLSMFVVNQRLEADVEGVALLEEYDLPVLQDTQEDDVFGRWEAMSYDAFVVAREGHAAWTINDTRPIRDYPGFVGILNGYITE